MREAVDMARAHDAAAVQPVSVVVPAHDEEAVIERCLRAMLEGAEPGELDIVVVANGCRDATAARARAVAAEHPGAVRVVELERPSKHGALVRGDAEARGFPRFFVDADVSLPLAALRSVAAVLRRGEALVAAPRMQVDLGESSWAARAYYRVWMRLPYHRSGTIGSGVYALSEAGRARVGPFPDIISDDGYVRLCFAPAERASIAGATFTITAPRDLAGVLAVKTRSQKGWRQLREQFPALVANDGSDYGGALGPLLADVRVWPALPVYALVAAITKFRAWRLNRSGRLADWERDESSRRPQAGGERGESSRRPQRDGERGESR
ncbi:MAG: glycosyltransferase [Myxococcales bacterium]|nr:glycosyltransferase [Myxococcales bacterium]